MTPVPEIAKLFRPGARRRFVELLQIADLNLKIRRLSPLLTEQEPWWDALTGPKRYILGLKPRQVGYTTLTLAFFYRELYCSVDPSVLFSVVHDEDAQTRLRMMVETFAEEMPEEIRPAWFVSNERRSTFEHNRATFLRKVAGGKGKGRSWRFSHLHATEMAHWSTASSASRGDEAGTSDEEAFASAMAALADNGRVVIESTGNGPKGLFHTLWRQAASGDDPKWAYVFVPWNTVPRYQEVPEDLEAFEDSLNEEERQLREDFGLTLAQLRWRRTKIETERWTPLRFRREYPLTDSDPFLFTRAAWFSQQQILRQLRWAQEAPAPGEIRIFKPYDPTHEYFVGGDTSGGVGKDYACCQVIRDDLAHAATWYSNTASPAEQAVMFARIAAMYGRPLVLIEANKYGAKVISRLATMGVRLWKDEKNRDFWSESGPGGQTGSKKELMVNAREVIDRSMTVIACKRTLLQLQVIVEKPDGRIEAAEGHDDNALAYAFALFAARGYGTSYRPVVSPEFERLRASLAPKLDLSEVRSVEDFNLTVGGPGAPGRR